MLLRAVAWKEPFHAALLAIFLGSLLTSSDGQAEVLMQVKAGLGGTVTSSWTGADPCGTGTGGSPWPGVFCSTTSPPSLLSLSLQASSASGAIPSAIFNLHNLTYLSLAGNPGVSGHIPDLFHNLPALQYLDMHECSLSGSLPRSLSSLTSLAFLAFNNNTLSGVLPVDLGNAVNLTWLDVNTNQISGPVPESLSQCSKLAHLHLSYNQLSCFPSSLTVLQGLVHILLDHNQFNQSFPTGFSTAPYLENIRLSSNTWLNDDVAAIIPPSLGEFYASNALAMPIPVPDLGSIPSLYSSLQVFDMNNNSLYGSVPESYANLTSLYTLSMRFNALEGSLPVFNSSIQPNLQVLDFQGNQISSVPLSVLGQPDGRYEPYLAGNPVCQGSLGAACQLNLSTPGWTNDTFNGICTAKASSFDYADVQQHRLWCPDSPTPGGVILPNPSVFSRSLECTCASPLVQSMILNSPAFTFLDAALEVFLLQRVFSTLKAKEVNVPGLKDINQVVVTRVHQEEGKTIPFAATLLYFPFDADTPLDTALIKATMRQDKLFLGLPFGLQYSTEFQDPVPLPTGPQSTSSSKKLSTGAIVGIAVGAFLAMALVLALVSLLVWRKARYDAQVGQDDWGSEDYAALEAIRASEVTKFRLSELRDATKGFSTLLGEGTYGQVYKGELASGQQVAVKRARAMQHQGGEAFRTEIELVSQLRHRNLLLLFGFCREAGEQLLVYEFVAQGTLADWIHGSKAAQGLPWVRRLAVAEGAARALAYLHTNLDYPIVHRDIKPANILVSEGFEAKVADFGLSKIMPHELEAAGGVGTRILGTVGYLDPEYTSTGMLTVKSDVYSFGVLLLQLATGRRVVEKSKNVRNWVAQTAGVHGIMSVMDPALANDNPSQDLCEVLVRLGMQASSPQAENRPSMQHIAEVLSEMRAHMGGKMSVRLLGAQSKDNVGHWAQNEASNPSRPESEYSGLFSQ